MNDCLLLCNLTAFHMSDADNNVQSVVDETQKRTAAHSLQSRWDETITERAAEFLSCL